MDLFSEDPSKPYNLLHRDGIAHYHEVILSLPNADYFYNCLFSKVHWKKDVATIFGKSIVTKRKVAWYGDNPYEYTYSNNTKNALPWFQELLDLKEIVEQETGELFNSCLLNLYHNGTEGMAWHSDKEKDLKRDGAIASISLGAERKFALKHKKTKEKVSVVLQHGSLLVMKGSTQTHWMHCLPPTKMVTRPRINLTFRTIANDKGVFKI